MKPGFIISPLAPTASMDRHKCNRLEEDIDMISNIASHTLKSPLHTILTYANELDERLIAHHMHEEQGWLQLMQQETLRMREMIAALFDYLSVEINSDAPRTPVDTTHVLSMVLGNLRSTTEQLHATITYDRLPAVLGREKYIASLFSHLVDNALTFHGDTPPVIHITATSHGNMCEFTIQDNGIGINEEFHDIIFILFQRLHSVDKYPGLGVGLAMCKKIVECAGGTIRVSSVPGKGSRFIFTLPAAL